MSEKFEQLNTTSSEQANQEKIDLSQFGLEKNTWLEKAFNGQDKGKYETAITDISEEVSKTFGDDSTYQEIIRAVFTALNNHWVSRCQTPKDFQQCAEIVIDIAKSQIRHNEKGEIDPPVSLQYFDIEKITTTAFLIEDLAEKAGGTFMQNADTLRLIIKDSIVMGHQEVDLVGTMWSLNKNGLLFSGESLRAIRHLVKSAAERRLDVKNKLKDLFGNNYAKNTGEIDEKGYAIYEPDDTFKKWRDVSKGEFAFNEDLWVIANSFQYDNDPISFVKKFNAMTIEEQNVFVSNARKFISKGIPPQVIADNPNLIYSCNLQKGGLAIFNHPEDKKWWLEYCAQVWKYNPASIDFTKHFFNEAISSEVVETVVTKEWNIPNIKGFSNKELDESQRDVDEELGAGEFRTLKEVRPDEQLREHASKLLRSTLEKLYETKEFDTICKIRDLIKGSQEFILALDKEKAGTSLDSELIKFISALGTEEEKVLPLTFVKAKEMIFNSLAENLDLADYFFENLPKYYQQPWVADNISKAVQHYSVAQKFITATEQDNTVWKNEAWVSNVSTQAKAVVVEHQKHWDQDDNQDSGTYSNRHGNEGFSTTDPYENDPWRFTAKEARLSTVLAKAIDGDIEAVKSFGELGMNLEKDGPIFPELNDKITEAYKHFLENIRMNPKIRDDDKKALLNPDGGDVKMTMLMDNVRSFVSRYLIQSIGGDIARISEIGKFGQDIDRIITEGFNKFIKVHEIEIPLYDKLYEEFDNLRETGRYPLEVFLGRDGIYAWIGKKSPRC